jgi:hypothetical protein
MPVTEPPTVRADVPPVAETSVAVHVGEPGVLERAKRSPQLAACPSMVTCVGDALTKIEPLRGGAPVATPVMLSAPHTGVGQGARDWSVKSLGVMGVAEEFDGTGAREAATSTDVELYAIARAGDFGAWVNVVTSRTSTS